MQRKPLIPHVSADKVPAQLHSFLSKAQSGYTKYTAIQKLTESWTDQQIADYRRDNSKDINDVLLSYTQAIENYRRLADDFQQYPLELAKCAYNLAIINNSNSINNVYLQIGNAFVEALSKNYIEDQNACIEHMDKLNLIKIIQSLTFKPQKIKLLNYCLYPVNPLGSYVYHSKLIDEILVLVGKDIKQVYVSLKQAIEPLSDLVKANKKNADAHYQLALVREYLWKENPNDKTIELKIIMMGYVATLRCTLDHPQALAHLKALLITYAKNKQQPIPRDAILFVVKDCMNDWSKNPSLYQSIIDFLRKIDKTDIYENAIVNDPNEDEKLVSLEYCIKEGNPLSHRLDEGIFTIAIKYQRDDAVKLYVDILNARIDKYKKTGQAKEGLMSCIKLLEVKPNWTHGFIRIDEFLNVEDYNYKEIDLTPVTKILEICKDKARKTKIENRIRSLEMTFKQPDIAMKVVTRDDNSGEANPITQRIAIPHAEVDEQNVDPEFLKFLQIAKRAYAAQLAGQDNDALDAYLEAIIIYQDEWNHPLEHAKCSFNFSIMKKDKTDQEARSLFGEALIINLYKPCDEVECLKQINKNEFFEIIQATHASVNREKQIKLLNYCLNPNNPLGLHVCHSNLLPDILKLVKNDVRSVFESIEKAIEFFRHSINKLNQRDANTYYQLGFAREYLWMANKNIPFYESQLPISTSITFYMICEDYANALICDSGHQQALQKLRALVQERGAKYSDVNLEPTFPTTAIILVLKDCMNSWIGNGGTVSYEDTYDFIKNINRKTIYDALRETKVYSSLISFEEYKQLVKYCATPGNPFSARMDAKSNIPAQLQFIKKVIWLPCIFHVY